MQINLLPNMADDSRRIVNIYVSYSSSGESPVGVLTCFSLSETQFYQNLRSMGRFVKHGLIM